MSETADQLSAVERVKKFVIGVFLLYIPVGVSALIFTFAVSMNSASVNQSDPSLASLSHPVWVWLPAWLIVPGMAAMGVYAVYLIKEVVTDMYSELWPEVRELFEIWVCVAKNEIEQGLTGYKKTRGDEDE